jgi:hypothetical protein
VGLPECEPFWSILFDLGALRCACRILEGRHVDFLTGISTGSCWWGRLRRPPPLEVGTFWGRARRWLRAGVLFSASCIGEEMRVGQGHGLRYCFWARDRGDRQNQGGREDGAGGGLHVVSRKLSGRGFWSSGIMNNADLLLACCRR